MLATKEPAPSGCIEYLFSIIVCKVASHLPDWSSVGFQRTKQWSEIIRFHSVFHTLRCNPVPQGEPGGCHSCRSNPWVRKHHELLMGAAGMLLILSLLLWKWSWGKSWSKQHWFQLLLFSLPPDLLGCPNINHSHV